MIFKDGVEYEYTAKDIEVNNHIVFTPNRFKLYFIGSQKECETYIKNDTTFEDMLILKLTKVSSKDFDNLIFNQNFIKYQLFNQYRHFRREINYSKTYYCEDCRHNIKVEKIIIVNKKLVCQICGTRLKEIND